MVPVLGISEVQAVTLQQVVLVVLVVPQVTQILEVQVVEAANLAEDCHSGRCPLRD